MDAGIVFGGRLFITNNEDKMHTSEFHYYWHKDERMRKTSPHGPKIHTINAKHPASYYAKHRWVHGWRRYGNMFVGTGTDESPKDQYFYTAMRVVRFMDATNFRTSNIGVTKALLNKEDRGYSGCTPSGFDHTSVWLAPDWTRSNKRHVVTTEPYGNPDTGRAWKHDAIELWCKENGCSFEIWSDHLGIWNPPSTVMCVIARGEIPKMPQIQIEIAA